MNKSKSNSKKLQELKLEYNGLVEELDEVRMEVELTKNVLKNTNDLTLLEELMHKRRTSNKIFTFPNADQRTKRNHSQGKLTMYEMFSGIHIKDIEIKYFPIYDKDKNIIDTSWLKFYVDAIIDKLEFNVSYISNKDMHSCFQDKVLHNEIKQLNIKMVDPVHQIELKTGFEYFAKNPFCIGLVFICIHDYNRLNNLRHRIVKRVSAENPDYLQYKFHTTDDDCGYLQIKATSVITLREYFKINWYIFWDEKILGVRNSFKIYVSYKDETFLDSVEYSFELLCKSDFDRNNLLEKSRNIRGENLGKSSDKHVPDFKLKILQNIMIAVKAADC